jgi:ribose transport system substrate-binding protein
MRSFVRLFCLPLLLAAFALMAGCQNAGQGGSASSSSSSGKRIGVTLLTREHEFYRDLEAGLKDAADKQGYQLTVTSGDFDLAKQQSQIENFVVQKMDAIIVCPADSKGIGPAIEQANSAGIPVFTADIAAQGGRVVSHVASDNLQAGGSPQTSSRAPSAARAASASSGSRRCRRGWIARTDSRRNSRRNTRISKSSPC